MKKEGTRSDIALNRNFTPSPTGTYEIVDSDDDDDDDDVVIGRWPGSSSGSARVYSSDSRLELISAGGAGGSATKRKRWKAVPAVRVRTQSGGYCLIRRPSIDDQSSDGQLLPSAAEGW
jgi:hypothetical protein